MNQKTEKALIKAVYKVLRPLVRLLLRHGVGYRTVADMLRHVYVDAAEQDFALGHRRPSNSRTAILTGINRKDIANLKKRPHPLASERMHEPNSLARVIGAWISDPRFKDANGRPKVLQLGTSVAADSFDALVAENSVDVTVRAMADELIRMGACEISERGLQLMVNAYIPLQDMDETLRIFSTAASDLLNTMDLNIAGAVPGPFLQRTVSYNNIPTELLEQIRARCRDEGDALLLHVNEWLAQHDSDTAQHGTDSDRHRVGIGMYYFEQNVQAPDKV